MKIVPAKQWMIAGFPLPASAHAYACLEGDHVDGLAGWYVNGPCVCIFSVGGDLARKHPITLARASRRMVEEAKSKGMPVLAQPSENIPGSERFLEFLGFRRLPNGTFLCQQTTS